MRYLEKFRNPDLGLLLIRLGLAAVFIVHGWAKLQNIEGTAGFFSSLGLGMFWVYLVAYVELLGGLAMLTGFLARKAGLLLAIDMFFAIYLVSWSRGFSGGYEFELLLLLTSLAIFLSGPGKYSLSKKY